MNKEIWMLLAFLLLALLFIAYEADDRVRCQALCEEANGTDTKEPMGCVCRTDGGWRTFT